MMCALCDNTFALPYSVTLAAKLRGASATLLIYDLYPEALVMAGFLQPSSWVTERFVSPMAFYSALLLRSSLSAAMSRRFYSPTKASKVARSSLFRTGRCCQSDIARSLLVIPPPASLKISLSWGYPESRVHSQRQHGI